MKKATAYVPPAPRLKTCAGCADEFVSRSNRGMFCTNRCQQQYRKTGVVAKRSGRACKSCGSPIPRDATLHQVYCSEQCRPIHRPNGRHKTVPRKLRERTIDCAYCGKTFTTAHSPQRFCSKWCGEHGYSSLGAPRVFEERLGRACLQCGDTIDPKDRAGKTYCSTQCQNRNSSSMRRARRRGLPVERINRAAVFERDDYTCHICMKPVEDKPVLDHIIPLAVPNSPGHVMENVAAAHAHCNFSKNARVRPEDYDLYIRLSLGCSVVA